MGTRLRARSHATLAARRRLEGIGGTGIAIIEMTIGGRTHDVTLKLESENPCGAIKDRTARALIGSLVDAGRLRPGMTIVESSSGNLALALASLAPAFDIGACLVVDPHIAPDKLRRLERTGAQIEMVDRTDAAGNYLHSRLRRVEQLVHDKPGFVWTDQYGSPANPRAHYTGTAPELHAQASLAKLVYVPVSTGGTFAGTRAYFARHAPGTEVVGVDVIGSVALGGSAGPRLLPGIGSSRRSHFVPTDVAVRSSIVDEGRAIACCRALRAQTGIAVGGSSGAALIACADQLADHPSSGPVAVLCPDGGADYTQTIYADDWVSRHKIDLAGTGIEPIERFQRLDRLGPAQGARRVRGRIARTPGHPFYMTTAADSSSPQKGPIHV